MKLLLREYLTLLKESDELDSLLPSLLLAMSIPPLTHAQKGVDQAGVDVAAVGNDPETKVKTLFLFVIKRGDIGNNDWDTGKQAVRPTLNRVKDVFIKNNISPEHKQLPIKVILCTGGGFKQDIQQEWKGYVEDNENPGSLDYSFWGGDQLSIFIEKYLFNENILPENLKSKFRKTLALLSDPDYDYSDYYSILDEILLEKDFGDPKKQPTKNKILKAFRTVNLCQNIIYFWSKSEDNLKPAILCSERTVLNSWDVVRRYELSNSPKILSAYVDLFNTLVNVYNEYMNKIHNHCEVKNAFSGYSRDYPLECLTIFENLGLISSAGLLFTYYAFMSQNNEFLERSIAVKELLKSYLNNQKASKAPCYDGHIIDISLALFLLSMLKENEFIDDWIKEVIFSTVFSYHHLGKYFPIQTDSFDDLVEVNVSESAGKSEYFQLSTLIPILAQWCVCLGLKDTYEFIQNKINDAFPECTMQIWYPDQDTDTYLYTENASYKSGNVEAPMDLSISFEEMENRIRLVQKRTLNLDEYSSHKAGLGFLPVLASRHYRTPFLPIYWQAMLLFKNEETEGESFPLPATPS